ncbi:phosphopantetheine-binding protein [Corallococcus coralloides]|uniref:phosphopantetheine-binding protein n=1 Tax=Corallococcus coralloides TaxID=184914 RepID=UPI003850A6C1
MSNLRGSIETQIHAALGQVLEQTGWRPRWTAHAVLGARTPQGGRALLLGGASASLDAELVRSVEEPDSLIALPVRRWDQELRQLWAMGAIYLLDGASHIASSVQIKGRRVLISRSRVEEFTIIDGAGVALIDSEVRGHSVLTGPLLLEATQVDPQAVIGPRVVVEQSYVAPFVKIQRTVRVRASSIGAHAALEGGNHVERYPQSRSQRRGFGVEVERQCWLGQHVSLSGGARLGEGVVVAAHCAVSSDVGEHVLVAGNPARALPVDLHLRELSAEQAREAGYQQGAAATRFPVYGACTARWEAADAVVLRHPHHGSLRGLAGPTLIDFHQGALEALLAQAFPDNPGQVLRKQDGPEVAFELRFAHPMPRYEKPSPTLTLSLTGAPGDLSAESPFEQDLVEVLAEQPCDMERLFSECMARAFEREELVEWAELEGTLCMLSQRGWVRPPLLPPVLASIPSLAQLLTSWPPGPPRARAQEAAPTEETGTRSEHRTRPREQRSARTSPPVLEQILNEVLGDGRTSDPDVTFLALGLDSFAFAHLIATIEERCGVTCPDLFIHNTPRKLAVALTPPE